ncbi:MAG TPA: hypothetical protein VLR90_03350, partial [Blastocatellia bacterium]|nr:hypothetical protein [Blastocatellia bacterium]
MTHTGTNIFQSLILLCMLISAPTIVCAQHSPKTETRTTRSLGNGRGALWRDTPQPIDTSAKYLFYLHGRIIEEEGINAVSQVFGAYEYEQILQTFVDKSFIVISEPRPKGTDVQQYAAKVVGQINILVQAGVPPQKITVVGASKGGSIAVATSSQLKN